MLWNEVNIKQRIHNLGLDGGDSVPPPTLQVI